MNAPDPADQELLELYGACLVCSAPRRLETTDAEAGPVLALVCSADVEHDAFQEPA